MNATVISLKEFTRRKSDRWTLYAAWVFLQVLPYPLLVRCLTWMHAHKRYFLRAGQ